MATSNTYVPTATGLFLRPLEIDQREEPFVSAQESSWQDDKERDRGQEDGRQQPEQGSENPSDEDAEQHDESDAERAVRNEADAIEQGNETPA